MESQTKKAECENLNLVMWKTTCRSTRGIAIQGPIQGRWNSSNKKYKKLN